MSVTRQTGGVALLPWHLLPDDASADGQTGSNPDTL